MTKSITTIYFCMMLIFTSMNVMASINEIDSEKTSVSRKNNDDYSVLVSLFFDAARTGNNEVIKKFVDSGFPINQKNTQSYTALMIAAYQGQKQTVQLLLNEGANACLKDKRGNTALLGALLKREIQIAKMLYQSECSYEDSKNKAGLNLKEFADIFGQTEVLKMLKDNKTQ